MIVSECNVTTCIAMAKQYLHSSETAQLDGEILLTDILQKDRAFIYANPNHRLSDANFQRFISGLAARACGEPIAYITGHKAFWTIDLAVSRAVLIPRPETELLVEQSLKFFANNEGAIRVLELGVGSGAIACSLASEKPAWQILAVDACPAALKIATQNAQTLQLDIQFLQSDWFSAIPEGATFDLIVSNPPYVSATDEHLKSLNFEPKNALVSGADGLTALKKIIVTTPNYLSAGGWLLFEHGYQQGEAVRRLMHQAGYTAVSTFCDLNGKERATRGQR